MLRHNPHTHLELSGRHLKSQLHQAAYCHAYGTRGVHLIPHSVTVHLRGQESRLQRAPCRGRARMGVGTWTAGHQQWWAGREGPELGQPPPQGPLAGALLTPMPPQGSMAYIFWLMGPAGKRNSYSGNCLKCQGCRVGSAEGSKLSHRKRRPEPSIGQASAACASWEMSVPCSGGTCYLWGKQQEEKGMN